MSVRDLQPKAARAFQTENSDDVSLRCPVCGTEAGIHFGRPTVIPGSDSEPERNACLIVPVRGDGCGHESHLTFVFHGGTVQISAASGEFVSLFD
jgi:hypothetical protein